MKCGAYVVWEERKRKGSGAFYMKAVKHVPAWFGVHPNGEIPEGAVRCDGDIIAVVRAAEEPYMGGCTAVLEIEYKCNKCPETFHNELPNTSQALSEFLTEAIAAIPQEKQDEWLATLRKDQEEHYKKMDAFRLELEARKTKGS